MENDENGGMQLFQIRMPVELVRRIRSAAALKGVSVAEFTAEVMEEALEPKPPKAPKEK